MDVHRISLLTDYGTYDGFVAACHGVIGAIAPGVPIVDVTHEVPPADVRRGAVVLAQTVPYLRHGVHIGVVDPGVGGQRRAVAIESPEGLFVGPDNGLLIWAAEALGGITRAVTLTRPEFHLPTVMATFHGRDIFGPVGGHLAAGRDLGTVGEPIDPAELIRLPEPIRQAEEGRIVCEMLSHDHFGNIQTSAGTAELAAARFPEQGRVSVTVGDRRHRMPLGHTFGDVEPGGAVAYVDSAGMLAVAVNTGNAAQTFGVRPGERIEIARLDA